MRTLGGSASVGTGGHIDPRPYGISIEFKENLDVIRVPTAHISLC